MSLVTPSQEEEELLAWVQKLLRLLQRSPTKVKMLSSELMVNALTMDLFHCTVVAIIQMGDPRHVPGQSFDRGTSLRAGLFPRLANQQYSATLQPRIMSFCDFNDPFCDSGADVEVHLTYLDRDQNTAAQFILTQIGG